MKDERDALGWGHRFEHDQEGHVDRLVECDSVGRVDGATRLSAEPLGGCRHRLRDPFAHIAFPSCPGRTQQVEADAAGDCHQPAAGGFDGLLLLRCHGVPAGVGLLNDVLSVGQRAE